jgi:hypothetical protein
VSGRVLRAELAEKRHHHGTRPARLVYRPRVRYTYAVGEVGYTGSALRAGDAVVEAWGSRKRAETKLQGLVPGREMTVFYNPGDPAEAALQVGARAGDFTLFVISFLLCMMAPLLLWFGLVVLAPENLGPPSL